MKHNGGDSLSRVCGRDQDTWFVRARNGDARAFEHLLAQVSPRIEASLRRLLRSDTEATSAALQDAWTAAWQVLDEFHSAEHLVHWLHRVAKCRAISGLRKSRRLVVMSWLEDEDASLPVPATRSGADPPVDVTGAVHDAIAALPDTYRGVATLYYLHGQPLQEVSRLVALPVSTVKMRLHRARLRLRRRLRRFASS